MERWQRRTLWIVGIVVAVVIVAGVVLWIALRSGPVHRYVLNTAREKASAAVGAPVTLGDFQLHMHGISPSVDVEGLAVAGSAPHAATPLLTVEHAHVDVTVTSLLHRTYELSNIELDHPVVHLVIDANGRTNLPAPSPSGGGTDLFQLGVRRFVVRRGEVEVNDRKIPLTADVRGVDAAVRFNPADQQYAGTLSYTDGTVSTPAAPRLTSSARLEFTANPSGARISNLRLASNLGQLDASLTVDNYANPRIQAAYLLAANPAPLLAGEVAGTVRVEGTADYTAGGPAAAEGRISAPRLEVRASGIEVPVSDLRAAYRLAGGNLTVAGLRGGALGGTVAADVRIRDVLGAALGEATATLRGVELARALRFAPGGAGAWSTLGQLGVGGRVNASIHATWRGAGKDLRLSTSSRLNLSLAGAPVEVALDAGYGGNRLTIGQGSLTAPSLAVRLAGSMDGGAAIRLQAQFGDLGRTESLADRVAAALGRPLPQLALAGRGTLTAEVSGSLRAPHVSGRLVLAPFSVEGTDWRSAEADFAASPSRAAVTRAALVPDSGGSVALSASVGLTHWSPTAASPIEAQLRIHDYRLATPSAGGVVEAGAAFHGTVGAPFGAAALTAAPAVVRAGGQSIGFQSIVAGIQGTGSAIVARLTAKAAAGTIEAGGTFHPRDRTYQARVDAGQLNLARLPLPPSLHLAVSGVVAVHASGQGSLAQPAFQVTIASPAVTVAGQTVQDIRAAASLAHEQAQATVAARVLESNLHGEAAVQLTGDWPARGTLEAPRVPLAPVLAALAPGAAAGVGGETAIHASFSGPLRDLGRSTGEVQLPVLELHYGDFQLAAAQPIDVQLAQGAVTLRPAHLTGTDTDLTAHGTLALSGGHALQAGLNGRVNLHVIQAFAGDLATSGELQLAVTAAGPLASPQLGGGARIENLSLAPANAPLALQAANGVLALHNDRVDIASFSGRLGGGTLTASGGVVFRPGLHFSLAAAARDVRLRYPPTVREAFNADLAFSGTPAASLLSGRVQVTGVSVTPQFDFANFLSQVAAGSTSVTAPGSFTQDLALNVAVTTPNQIHAQTRDFSLEGNANVTLRGTLDEPVVLGRVTLNSGDLIFRGDRYLIQSGTLDFINPARTEPSVNLTANTIIQQYDLHLHFQGPVENMHTTYTSDPSLPPADIINLLAFGQTTEAAAANPAPGNLGAENLIAGAVSSQITDRVQRIAGISQLSVDPVLGGGQQAAGARVTIQQRVTGNLFVTVSADVTGTARNVIEVQYTLSPRTSISGVRDQNGGFGVSTRFKRIW